MSEETMKILQMVQEGKITAQEGAELLEAIDDKDADRGMEKGIQKGNDAFPGLNDRFLKVRVDNAKTKVNVNIPLRLLKVTSRLVNMGMGYIPEEARLEMEKKGVDISKIDFEELIKLVDEGLVDGKLVDVDAEDPVEGRTKVEVYVE